jgi:hypothetical protein
MEKEMRKHKANIEKIAFFFINKFLKIRIYLFHGGIHIDNSK